MRVLKLTIIWFFAALGLWAVFNTASKRFKNTNQVQTVTALQAANIKSLQKDPFTSTDAALIKKNGLLILERAPLDSDALIHSLLANYNLTQKWERPEGVIASLLRDSRNRLASQSLLRYAAIEQDYDTVVKQLDVLIRLDGIKNSTHVNSLAQIYNSKEGQRVIDRHLRHNPPWGYGVLRPNLRAMQLANRASLHASLFSFLDVQDNLVHRKILLETYLFRLIELGLISEAVDIWQGLPETSPRLAGDTINNPEFLESDGPAPFNWAIYNTKLQIAELDQDGLFVAFDGTFNGVFARQYLMLPEGFAGRLNISARWRYDDFQGRFYWQLRCLSDRTVLAEISMDERYKEKEQLSVAINNIPENCPLQDLVLLGAPGEFLQRLSAQIRSVNIQTP